MTTGPAWNVQKAVYAKLTGDSTLTALVANIHEHVPQTTTYPYLSIHIDRVRDWSTKSNTGFEIIFEVHGFTNDRGSKTCQGIMDRIYQLLHDGTLTITGYTLILCRLLSSEIVERREAPVYHGVSVFKAKVQ